MSPVRDRYWDGTQWLGYVPSPVTPPPEVQTTLIGVYNGAPNENPDAATLALTGYYPQIASTYYQGNNTVNMAYETGRIGRGTALLLTKTIRNSSPAVTMADVANETSLGVAFLDGWINSLKTLSEIDLDVPVYATIDHEAEVKYNQGNITATDWANYPAALDVFIQRCRAEAPLVQTLYWFGGSDKTKINTVLTSLTEVPHAITLDPYRFASHPSTEDFFGSIEDEVIWLRANSAYIAMGEPPIGISETGTDQVQFTDANNAAWWTGLRDNLISLDLIMGVLFNRNSADYDYKIDTYPLTVAAFSAEQAH